MQECASDLCEIGLVTILNQHDVMKCDFDRKDRTLIFQTTAQAEFLKEAGFVETTRATVN